MEAPQAAPQDHDLLLRLIAGTAVALAVLYVALLVFWGVGPVLVVLTWFHPAVDSFLVLAAISVAYLSFGRFKVLREPLSFWVGAVFAAFAVFTFYHLLAWPALLQSGRGVIGRLAGTTGWYIQLGWTCLTVLPVLTALAPTRLRGVTRLRRWGWVVFAEVVVIAAVCAAMVVLERYLPLLTDRRGAFTSWYTLWQVALTLVAVPATVLSALRFRRSGDRFLGFLVWSEVVFTFAVATGILGGVRYDPWWYLRRFLTMGGVAIVLFGLLSEYVGLYRRERQRAAELEALQHITDPALARQGLERLISDLLERTVAIMGADGGAVLLLDPAGRELQVRAAAGALAGQSIGQRLPVGEDLAGRVLADNAVLWTHAAQAEPPPLGPYLRAAGIQTLIGMPLHTSGGPIGVAMVCFLQPRSFGPADVRMLEVMAERVVVATYQMRLLGAEHQAREQAEVALRARDEFLGVAAHELKTPITTLRGHAELTLKRMDAGRIQDPQEVHRALETIDRQAERLSILVNQLLDVSGLDTGELQLRRQVVDVVELTRRLVDSMQATTKRHALALHAPPSLLADVDPARLEEVLYNLIDNAIRYSPAGGAVEIDLSTPDPDTVRFAVRDYGMGVPPEQRVRLFTRFFQGAERPVGGLGLGLYVSRRIVDLHGGRIWAEFPPEGGSRFVVTVPRGLAP